MHYTTITRTLLAGTAVFVPPALGAYEDEALAAIKAMQDKWYSAATGRWNDMWWQSANIATAIAKFGSSNVDFKPTAEAILATTFEKISNPLGGSNDHRWLNGFYDDEGWWALAWIAAFDLTGDSKYLDTAREIFDDMTGGWTTPCNGGIWWDKEKTQVAAIANELFLSVAAHLANRVPDNKREFYRDWARREWDWFKKTGIINGDNIVNDGIDKTTCKNDGKWTFTYNQGVVLGGLAELSKATGDQTYIDEANKIVNGALNKLTKDSILTEPSEKLDETSAQFKGAFVRGLAALLQVSSTPRFETFLSDNAKSAWDRARTGDGVIKPDWAGNEQGEPSASSHASGVDLLVATAQVSDDHIGRAE